VGAIGFALFLVLVGIPQGVNAPRNVARLVLSPTFWPYIIAGAAALIGAALVLAALRMPPDPQGDAAPPHAGRSGWARLAVTAVLMALYVYAIPRIGMVWASMAAFLAVALLVRNSHPRVALVAAVAIPLALYFFFGHVAGVSIPQGRYVRLP